MERSLGVKKINFSKSFSFFFQERRKPQNVLTFLSLVDEHTSLAKVPFGLVLGPHALNSEQSFVHILGGLSPLESGEDGSAVHLARLG